MGKLTEQSLPATDVTSVGSALTLDDLLSLTPEQLSRVDIAEMNLICASGLPGAEGLNIPKCLRRLDFMAEQIRKETSRDLPSFRANSRLVYKTDTAYTECQFRMAHLASVMQGEFKMQYDSRFIRDPKKKAEVNWRNAFIDSRAILIHGLLGEKRSGIFTPISVVAAAIGRRLGYPIYLSCSPCYDWVRWDGRGERFNIEIHDGGCHIVLDDEGYRKRPEPMSLEQERSGYFLRNLTSAEELALCLFCRAWVLECNLRFEESLTAWTKCCYLVPANPEYAKRAKIAAGEAVFMRKRGRAMDWTGNRFLRPVEVVEEDPRKIFEPKLAAMVFAIAGHADEAERRPGNAMNFYRLALETDPDNPHHKANFDRFRRNFHEELVQGHIKTQETIRRNGPHVKLPPLDESVRRFREALQGKRPENEPPQDPKRMEELLRMARSAQAWHHYDRGKAAMAAGKWVAAQTAFAQAFFGGDEKEKRTFLANLRSAIKTEVERIAPPNAIWVEAPDADRRDNPLFNVAEEVAAFVWHNRGRVLEQSRRYGEAGHAYDQAQRLMPKHTEYAKDKDRIDALEANPEATSKPAPPMESYLSKVEPLKPELSKHFASAYGSKGMERGREGKWDRAQTAFVRACAYATNAEERQHWHNYLCKAVYDELAAPQLQSTTDDNPPQEDLRLTLEPALQAEIWSARGKVLESMGRLSEAVDAYTKANSLAPGTKSYNIDAARIRQAMANRSPGLPGVYAVGPACPSPAFHYYEMALAPQIQLGRTRR